MLVNVIIGLIQLILAIVLAVLALYAGFFTFSRIVKNIDVPYELARGNKAIGIFVASVFISISVTVYSCIQGIMVGLNKIFADGSLNINDTLDVISSCLELIMGVLLAIGSIYLAIHVFSRLNHQTDMIRAMKTGMSQLPVLLPG